MAVKYPEEISDEAELISFGHSFAGFTGSKIFYHAAFILDKREYQIKMKLDEILMRAISDDRIRVSYRPVLSGEDDSVLYAEAISEVDDMNYGEIDEGVLAELSGGGSAFIRYEECVLGKVFAYAGSGDMTRDGFSYVAVRLSAYLCMQRNLTDLIWNLRSQNSVHPEHICLIFTESAYDSMDETYDDNMEKLLLQGYKVISGESEPIRRKRGRKVEKDTDNRRRAHDGQAGRESAEE